MTTKAEYLKKYLEGTGKNKKKKRVKKRINLAVHDDDVDWRTLIPVSKEADQSDSDENNPDEAPLVAEFKDDSVRKWQPVSNINIMEKEKGSAHKRRMDSPDMSPPRMKVSGDLSQPHQRRSLSPDLSPPRRGNKSTRRMVDHGPPCRKRSVSSDLSPPRRGDISPPHQRISLSSDFSPPRPLSPGIISTPCSKRWRENDDTNRILIDRKLDNKQDLHSVAEITSKSNNTSDEEDGEGVAVRKVSSEKSGCKNVQEPLLHGLDSTKSGRYAETVYRDKDGRKIDHKLERIKAEQEERQKREENEKFMLWGRGIAQTKSAQQKIADDLYEMSKPLARYADDEDLERMLKEREREGDPMLAFIRKKTERIKQNTGEKPNKGKPTYKGSAPPNRFGIRPGYRWDGVDRSNGFEKAWFSRDSNKKAFDEEAYKWSVEDM